MQSTWREGDVIEVRFEEAWWAVTVRCIASNGKFDVAARDDTQFAGLTRTEPVTQLRPAWTWEGYIK